MWRWIRKLRGCAAAEESEEDLDARIAEAQAQLDRAKARQPDIDRLHARLEHHLKTNNFAERICAEILRSAR
jgi:hypothetical protein